MHKDSRFGFSAARRRLMHLGVGALVVQIAACYGQRPPAQGPVPGARWIARLRADASGSVWRNARSLPYEHGMALAAGDEIETDGANFALIDFANGDAVYMAPRTRVRVGSIFVFFGEIFNRIVSGRGFSAESEAMEAGVEETEFLMRVDRASQEATVVVRRGTVRCVPRNANWTPRLVRPNQRLSAKRSASYQPQPFELNPDALGNAMRWADEATRRIAPRRVSPEKVPQGQVPPSRQYPSTPDAAPPVR